MGRRVAIHWAGAQFPIGYSVQGNVPSIHGSTPCLCANVRQQLPWRASMYGEGDVMLPQMQ